jgi:hypothetical protein
VREFVKRIMFSLVIGLFLISLSIPVYAPARRPDYIEWMPVVPVADVSMDYGGFVIRSITGSGWGGFVGEPVGKAIVIDCIGYGIASITWTTSGSVGNFVQRFSLKVAIDDAIRIGEPLEVTGQSNLTVFTTEGKVTFKGTIDGTIVPDSNFIDAISFLVALQYRAGSTQEYAGEPEALQDRLFISLNIEGLVSNPSDVSASGQLLSLEVGQNR